MNMPQIGIVPLIDIQRESYWMLPGYMEGIADAGGLPIMLPLTADPAAIRRIAQLCDGFLFTGGHDLSPELYGQEILPLCGERCPERDAMERLLFPAVMELDKPVLGICRGLQFINVMLGGTLFQDIPAQIRWSCPAARPCGSCWAGTPSRSTAATTRGSGIWPRRCAPWRTRPTGWWRRCGPRTGAMSGRSSGTRSFPA